MAGKKEVFISLHVKMTGQFAAVIVGRLAHSPLQVIFNVLFSYAFY